MNSENAIYFLYGMEVMFCMTMAWVFSRKDRQMLSLLIMGLMILLTVQYVKDLFFIPEILGTSGGDAKLWPLMNALDMTAEPFYAMILIELCTPGRASWPRLALHELPFLALPLLMWLTGSDVFYDMLIGWAAVYGVGYAVWTLVMIPRYHRRLRERFSYVENINLKWLRYILLAFFVILALWISDCFNSNVVSTAAYSVISLMLWLFICRFVYRHESVISELGEAPAEAAENVPDEEVPQSVLESKISAAFDRDRLFLNPALKLSDVAAAVGSNRTYVSNYFNRQLGISFYDFVNTRRIDYACSLLGNTSETVENIAYKSGFNSASTFYRVFVKVKGTTPAEFRKSACCSADCT